MKSIVLSFVSGLLFALGLGISGMTQPMKVLAFLNVGGAWDPSLLFVMGAAVLGTAVAWAIVRTRRQPIFAKTWNIPPTSAPITKSLVAGSVMFGVGWGMVGYCPGPAFVSLVGLRWPALLFVLSMLAGMALHKIVSRDEVPNVAPPVVHP